MIYNHILYNKKDMIMLRAYIHVYCIKFKGLLSKIKLSTQSGHSRLSQYELFSNSLHNFFTFISIDAAKTYLIDVC